MTLSIKPTAIAAAFVLSTMGSAQAAPITSLEQCYNAVITWCTNTYPEHADQCGQSSALNDCDEEFGNTTASNAGFATGIRRVGLPMSDRAFQRLLAGGQVLRRDR